MIKVKKVTFVEGQEPVEEVFILPHLNKGIYGYGVTSKVLYDLRKGRKASVEYTHENTRMTFEVVA